MRILVLTTGGTIGSGVEEGFITPSAGTRRLEEICLAAGAGRAEFAFASPFQMLSENATGETLHRLIEAVRAGLEKADGLLVTHGTDTLGYGAAALSYALGRESKPVVLASSNYVLEDARANGADNLRGGVEWLLRGGGRGVYVSYRNAGEPIAIHRGSRLLKHAACQDAVYSLWDAPVARIREEQIRLNPHYREADDAIPPLNPVWEEPSPVVWLSAHPGMRYPVLTAAVRAVLLESYHAGTLCTAGGELRRFCQRAARRGIPVFLVGITGETPYDSAREYASLGIRPLPPMAPQAAYLKLWMLLSAGRDVCREMALPLGGDCAPVFHGGTR